MSSDLECQALFSFKVTSKTCFYFLSWVIHCRSRNGLVSVIAALDWFSGWRRSKEGSSSVKSCNLPTTFEWSPIPLTNVHRAGFTLHGCWARSVTDVGSMVVVRAQAKVKRLAVWYHRVLCVLRCCHKTCHYFTDHLQSNGRDASSLCDRNTCSFPEMLMG